MDTSNNSFLPDGYKEPVKSNFMNLELGDNAFRVLAPAKIGWEYWTEGIVDGVKKNIPHRVTKEDSIPMADVVINKFGKLNVNFFWAFPVYNWTADRIQILQITQATIRKAIESYLRNKSWGNPTAYNLVVTKTKTGDKTEYSVMPEPKEELPVEITKRFESMKLDMNVWMAGGDPFTKTANEATEAFIEEAKEPTTKVSNEIPF